MGDLPPLIRAMLSPSFYPHRPKRVELLQTHISYVFLTGELVYKVKKPVDFGFLDFTTLEKRRHFSEEELRLNRRLSPEIYLEVTEIKEEDGRFSLGGEGETVEVAVVMKQLPASRNMERLLEEGKVTEGMVDELASLIASFHRSARTDPYISSFGEAEKVAVSIVENFEQTSSFIGVTIPKEWYEELRDYSYGFLEERKGLFSRRVAEGRVREGHGDLHTQNVYFVDKIYVLDCIEFNERFRFLDVANDIAFLLMDLEHKGAWEVANRFLNSYLAESGDYGLISLLRFYKIYRAYVRGKVIGFETRMEDIPIEQRERAKERARGYFALSYRYLTEGRRPFLLATTGVIGSGKSYLSLKLAPKLGAVVIRSDALRKALAGLSPRQKCHEPFLQGIYYPEMTERVYEEMVRQAREILEEGIPVILDGSFSKREQRRKVLELASEGNYPYLFLHTQCPLPLIEERLRGREDISDGRLEILPSHLNSYEPPEEIPRDHLMEVSTEGDPSLDPILEFLGLK